MPKARRDAAALRTLEREAAGCRRCSLWARATQTVFGSGAPKATFVFVGEQPGDVEDQAGEPFVGPAGQLLRSCIEEAGLDIDDIYLTNAVKHFKWRPQGKRRLHERPNREEILACRMWLEEELRTIAPTLVVALGATAVTSLLGAKVRVLRDRGTVFPSELGAPVMVTVHPSSILRAPDSSARETARRAFVSDLKSVARFEPGDRPSVVRVKATSGTR